ncbi:hypothetical protein LTR05_004173 [Lithohypha guttulata]|uniref:Epoxide hydrolase n=1 Tax=Lithohypha guttulata TaxID=1690604 RepID=A0AAN7T2E0_9EURO|nr:hypothetical protein LTR05_004173 [Lithohypha guttulata]
MSTTARPKVLLFDIGGVCVVSPFQAILDYEKAHNIPTGYVNFSISFSKPNGAWQKLERGEIPLDENWFAAWKKDIQNPKAWETFHKSKVDQSNYNSTPPMPDVKVDELYWMMMSISRQPDPHMGPALRKLKETGRWKLAALSNTSIFPPGHPFNEPRPDDVRDVFEVFISSAHVGMRKPDRNIYEFTMKKLSEKWPEAEIEPKDIVFFDDIGENLKMGKSFGWRTVKVWLGKTDETVKVLERITGEQLLETSRAKL